jgi:multisubunit Na+/H+ antiporter MnhB subunit
MNHLEVYGPYKSKRAPWWRRVVSALGYMLIAALAILIAWIALLWALDFYLSIGMSEHPVNTGAQYHL